jgi:hypothetical protein
MGSFMCAEKERTASRLRSRAATARRLALEVTQATDRDSLLQFAAELEAEAERLDGDGGPAAKD